MRPPLLFTLIIVYTVINFTKIIEGKPTCLRCADEEECNKKPPEVCEHGETRDSCNRKVCAKGPGTRCGGMLGQCGEGMWCHNDDKCHGCSIYTYKCYQGSSGP